jgi:hypothetical protein
VEPELELFIVSIDEIGGDAYSTFYYFAVTVYERRKN